MVPAPLVQEVYGAVTHPKASNLNPLQPLRKSGTDYPELVLQGIGGQPKNSLEKQRNSARCPGLGPGGNRMAHGLAMSGTPKSTEQLG